MMLDSANVRAELQRAGWFPGRSNGAALAKWSECLKDMDSPSLHDAARQYLVEFGGIAFDGGGAGVDCARTQFELDPTHALKEAELFKHFSAQVGSQLAPLGTAEHGAFYIAADECGRVFLLGDTLELLGESIEEALERLILGKKGQVVEP